VRDGILDAVEYARGSYLNPHFPDDVCQAREDLSVLPRDKVIRDFLYDIHDALGRIDELIDRHVGGEDRTRAAFDLGRRLEELLCRDQIERWLYDPNLGDDPGRLANVQWWPGDATLEPGQLEEIKGLAADAGLPTAVVERFDGLRDLAPAAMVERLAEVIGPALAKFPDPGMSGSPSVDTDPPKKDAAGPSRATTIRASGPNDPRDAFVYENYDKMTGKELRAALGKHEHWRQVKYDREIHQIARRYASRHNLPVKVKSGRSPLHQVSSSDA
jgi:hypothetical protein